MRKSLPLLLAAVVVALAALPILAAKAKPSGNLYANIETNLGTIVVQFFEKEAPKTVANFTGLAMGTKQYKDPKGVQFVPPYPGAPKEMWRPDYSKAKWIKGRYYDGLVFHRVIDGFMIQGGCPFSKDADQAGKGGPGYEFEDEFVSSLRHDKPGRLSMANSGPGTNGSQFFITVAPTPHLDNRHTIFGQVVVGQEVAVKISKTPRKARDRPAKQMVIKTVKVYRAEKPKL